MTVLLSNAWSELLLLKIEIKTRKNHFICEDLSRLMGKPTICIGENKDADQLRGNREADLISAFVFAIRIVQFLFYLNPKFQASSSFPRLYRPVCVGPGRKPHCWFSHEAAHLIKPAVKPLI